MRVRAVKLIRRVRRLVPVITLMISPFMLLFLLLKFLTRRRNGGVVFAENMRVRRRCRRGQMVPFAVLRVVINVLFRLTNLVPILNLILITPGLSLIRSGRVGR